MLNGHRKNKSKDQAILEIFYAEKSSNLISRKNFLSRKNMKNQIIKVFEMTESICCFSICLPTCKKSYNTYIQP